MKNRFLAWRRQYGGAEFDDYPNRVFNYQKRYKLYDHLKDVNKLAERPFTYLEFGVARGKSIRWWLENLTHSQAVFVGFDVFTGLPEPWRSRPRGTFSTNGRAPEINDIRCRFVVGMFQDTLQNFLDETDAPTLPHPWVIHLDADLYSSTLFVLFALSHHLRVNDLIVFDEFTYCEEFRAFEEFVAATGLVYELVGAVNNYHQIALKLNETPGYSRIGGV